MDEVARHNSDVIAILLLTIITQLAHSVYVLKICILNGHGYIPKILEDAGFSKRRSHYILGINP
ncbi:MAG: hypothetical protein COA83_09475 [Methylophaga sp.]|nr:MAG: hypothetical protein COA83_09475 [Methylophaga sp.]